MQQPGRVVEERQGEGLERANLAVEVLLAQELCGRLSPGDPATVRFAADELRSVLGPSAEPGREERILGVVECKLWVNSVANVDQVARYRLFLDDLHPDWTVAGHLVAQSFSAAVLAAAVAQDIVCWQLAADDDGYFLVPLDEHGEPLDDEESDSHSES